MDNTEISRRELLKKAAKASLVLSGVLAFESLTDGCAIVPKDRGPVRLVQLKDKKVKYPEHGLLWGVNGFWESNVGNFSLQKSTEPHLFLKSYQHWFGYLPAINNRMCANADQSFINYPSSFILNTHSINVIPYDLLSVSTSARLHGGLEKLIDNKGFIQDIKRYAQGVVDNKIPQLVTTMREMNDSYGRRRPWKGKSAKVVTKLYKQMWQVCEDTGANKWLTWVWSILPPEAHSNSARNPEWFFPGEQRVDYIGFSVYGNFMGQNKSFPYMIHRTYEKMQKNHPTIPIIMSEIGYFLKPGKEDNSQAKFFDEAIQTMQELQAFKGLITWNSSNPTKKRYYMLSIPTMNIIKKYLDNGVLLGADKLQKS